jgi:hypothetical protein
MNLLLLFSFLICASVNAGAAKITMHDRLNVARLTQTYYNSQEVITLVVATRLERMLSWIHEQHFIYDSYCNILEEMAVQDRLDDFSCLYPLVDYEDWSDDIIMLDVCVHLNKMQFIDYILSQGLNPDRFSRYIVDWVQDLYDPYRFIVLVECITGRDARIAAKAPGLFYDVMNIILETDYFTEGEPLRSTMKLVEMGLDVDDALIYKCQRSFPNDERLCQFLRESQLPDVKEPEC